MAVTGMVFVVLVCTLNSCGRRKIPLIAVDHVLSENPYLDRCVVFKGNSVISTGTKDIRQQGAQRAVNCSFPVRPSGSCGGSLMAGSISWLVRVVKVSHGVCSDGCLLSTHLLFVVPDQVPYFTAGHPYSIWP